jgi:hypothetical protein
MASNVENQISKINEKFKTSRVAFYIFKGGRKDLPTTYLYRKCSYRLYEKPCGLVKCEERTFPAQALDRQVTFFLKLLK